MDRLNRTLAGCGLAFLMVAGSGCRSTPSSVPPGHAYGTSDGKGGFNSEPHPMTSAAPPAAMSPYGAGGPGGAAQFGTPSPGAATSFGGPTGPMYGPPGSSPLGQVPTQPSGMASPSPIGGAATAAPGTNIPGSPGSFPAPQ